YQFLSFLSSGGEKAVNFGLEMKNLFTCMRKDSGMLAINFSSLLEPTTVEMVSV
ncbi:hypothetical protein A2U01_0038372, partial [Trifolium medium]|nr:hypothetical protein [Trifolium medium]